MSHGNNSPRTEPKSLLEVLSVFLLLGIAQVTFLIFNSAMVNGGQITVDLNRYGEMVPELLLLQLVVTPIIGVGLYSWHRR